MFTFIFIYKITNKTDLYWVVCLSETYLFDGDRQEDRQTEKRTDIGMDMGTDRQRDRHGRSGLDTLSSQSPLHIQNGV